MARLPVLSGKELIRALVKDGFEVVRRRASHVSLRKGTNRTVVPLHDDLSKGTLIGILSQCGLSRENLIGLMGK